MSYFGLFYALATGCRTPASNNKNQCLTIAAESSEVAQKSGDSLGYSYYSKDLETSDVTYTAHTLSTDNPNFDDQHANYVLSQMKYCHQELDNLLGTNPTSDEYSYRQVQGDDILNFCNTENAGACVSSLRNHGIIGRVNGQIVPEFEYDFTAWPEDQCNETLYPDERFTNNPPIELGSEEDETWISPFNLDDDSIYEYEQNPTPLDFRPTVATTHEMVHIGYDRGFGILREGLADYLSATTSWNRVLNDNPQLIEIQSDSIEQLDQFTYLTTHTTDLIYVFDFEEIDSQTAQVRLQVMGETERELPLDFEITTDGSLYSAYFSFHQKYLTFQVKKTSAQAAQISIYDLDYDIKSWAPQLVSTSTYASFHPAWLENTPTRVQQIQSEALIPKAPIHDESLPSRYLQGSLFFQDLENQFGREAVIDLIHNVHAENDTTDKQTIPMLDMIADTFNISTEEAGLLLQKYGFSTNDDSYYVLNFLRSLSTQAIVDFA